MRSKSTRLWLGVESTIVSCIPSSLPGPYIVEHSRTVSSIFSFVLPIDLYQ
ncbi:hypothetical protein FRC08_009653 [Ceratobasidium sp. 394]|nr:hypothetical protein FRC08_009653 [Ceratobasidium sp. 394]